MKKITSILLMFCLVCSLCLPFTQMVSAQKIEIEQTPAAAASWDVDGDGTLSILCIGNSFSVDAME